MEAVVAVVLAKAALIFGAGIHPVFDHRSDYYSQDLKSCLSSDLAEHELASCRFFAITIDAGSTGTRLHLFELSHDVTKESSLFKVEREIFREVCLHFSVCFADELVLMNESRVDVNVDSRLKGLPRI